MFKQYGYYFLALGLLCGFIISLAFQQRLVLLIHPRYLWLTIGAAVVTIVVVVGLSLWQWRQQQSWLEITKELALIAVIGVGIWLWPLLGVVVVWWWFKIYQKTVKWHISLAVGLTLLTLAVFSLIPLQTLTTQTVNQRGINNRVPASLPISEWVSALSSSEDPQKYLGRSLDLTGVAIGSSDLGEEYFMLGQFVITCCVVDAQPVAMIIKQANPHTWTKNQWLRVQGKVQEVQVGNRVYVVIEANVVEVVAVPDQPYLY